MKERVEGARLLQRGGDGAVGKGTARDGCVVAVQVPDPLVHLVACTVSVLGLALQGTQAHTSATGGTPSQQRRQREKGVTHHFVSEDDHDRRASEGEANEEEEDDVVDDEEEAANLVLVQHDAEEAKRGYDDKESARSLSRADAVALQHALHTPTEKHTPTSSRHTRLRGTHSLTHTSKA